MDKVYIRCKECGQVNRVEVSKFHLKPHCRKCSKTIQYPDSPLDITQDNFKQEVLKDPGYVLIDFWAPYCSYCQSLNPILREIASEYAGIVKIVRVNTQQDQHLPSLFEIKGIPTLILYNDGRIVNRASGAMNKLQLINWIKSTANI